MKSLQQGHSRMVICFLTLDVNAAILMSNDAPFTRVRVHLSITVQSTGRMTVHLKAPADTDLAEVSDAA